MRCAVRNVMALAGVTLLLAGGCSDKNSTSTSAGLPSSSSPSATTTVAPPATTSPTTTTPPTTVPAAPAVAEAAGWRLVINAPTAGATIGQVVDLCYDLTGPQQAPVAFEVSLVLNATGTVAGKVSVDASVGRGSARVNLGTPDPRRYDMAVQGLVNGQRVEGLNAIVRGVIVGIAAPAGCP